jgi:death-on-curing family protein
MNTHSINKGKIIIYKSKDGPKLEVRLEGENVWLPQNEIAHLYRKDRTVITKHIHNIFNDKEVDQKRNVQNLHIPNSDKPVTYYSLDVILAVGYRTNSSRAIQFRKWSTNILKKYILRGYAINETRLLHAKKQLLDLQQTISFLQKKSRHELLVGQEQEILSLLADYSKTLTLLEQYDKEKLSLVTKTKGKFVMRYEDIKQIIDRIKNYLVAKHEASTLFGQENNQKLQGILGSIYQTFDGNQLYTSLEEQAAHLLYFIIKDHPFVDGNKRIASLLFIYFLDRNEYLYKNSGEKKINDNALTILSLLTAISNPKEKNNIIKIITNLLTY